MMWLEVVQQLGIVAIVVSALAWIGRRAVTHWLDKNVAKYQSDLRNAHDVELEKLRNDLRLAATEHEVRFRSLHAKQAEVIAETYKRLCDVHTRVASYVNPLEWQGEPTKDEKAKIAAAAVKDFNDFFYPRLIFLPRETGSRVKELANKLVGVANEFSFGRMGDGHDYWSKAHNFLKDEVPPLLLDLQNEFQRLLGVSTATGQRDGQEKQSQ